MADGNGDGFKIYQGVDGIPYRTKMDKVPNFRRDDPFRSQPQMVEEAHVDRLLLSNEEDVAKYNKVLNETLNGRGRILTNEKVYDPDIKSWRVLLVWSKYYLEDPKESDSAQRVF